ncbi:MAG: hypothetical protein CFE37_06690 [Alphaproteobacteria bacterium PA4]|nr:MAG: hypothetical protein CFE37_06690 [Alphaproteobacteria bacterium PA4]
MGQAQQRHGRRQRDSEPVTGVCVEEAEIRARIEIARRDHRDLDSAIEALRQMPTVDMIQLQRFKKRKLRLRDEIAVLEDMLIPDIIA